MKLGPMQREMDCAFLDDQYKARKMIMGGKDKVYLGKVSIKKNIKSYGIFHTGGGGLHNFHNFFRKKRMFFS